MTMAGSLCCWLPQTVHLHASAERMSTGMCVFASFFLKSIIRSLVLLTLTSRLFSAHHYVSFLISTQNESSHVGDCNHGCTAWICIYRYMEGVLQVLNSVYRTQWISNFPVKRPKLCSLITENKRKWNIDRCTQGGSIPHTDWYVTLVLCVLIHHESVDSMETGYRDRGQTEMVCQVFLLLFVCCFSLCLQFCLT